nr:hypothetical protein Iba_chr15bCG11670 [Ipomoea batatas]
MVSTAIKVLDMEVGEMLEAEVDMVVVGNAKVEDMAMEVVTVDVREEATMQEDSTEVHVVVEVVIVDAREEATMQEESIDAHVVVEPMVV